MNILITISNFHYLTGAELYVYELARELNRLGHKTYIISALGEPLVSKAREAGLDVHDFKEFVDKAIPFQADIIHSQQEQPTFWINRKLPLVPMVKTIHSWYETEKQFVHPQVRHYIYVHTETKPYLLEAGVPEDKMTLIRNGIDLTRFTPSPVHNRIKKILFAGTVDPFRKEAAIDVMRRAERDGAEVWFIGHRFDDYLDITPAHVTYKPALWNIEDYVKQCDETVGILFGRWLIEGWACGKPGTLYHVNKRGLIDNIERLEPAADMSEYDIKYMAQRILTIYHAVLS